MPAPYFAYGSNLDGAGLSHNEVPYLGNGLVENHRLAFSRRSMRTGAGVADIVPAAGCVVWGALYSITPAAIVQLDLKEGHGWAYERRPIAVVDCDGVPIDAFAYLVIHKEPAEIAPSPSYLEAVLRGARMRGLPEEYIASVERHAEELMGGPRGEQ